MPRGRNPRITKEYRQERWDRCMKYLRENRDLPTAMKAAHVDGFSADTSVWITALSKMLERGERPGCAIPRSTA